MQFNLHIVTQRSAFTMKQLLIVIAVSATAIGLLVPLVQKVREANIRSQSINNLKNLALACHSFHDAHKHLPYNGTAQSYMVNGVSHGGFALPGDARTGSWAFQILPYVDQGAVFASRDATVGVPVFMCPSRGRPLICQGFGGPGAWTDYILNSFINDPNGAWDVPDAKRTFIGMADGNFNTILIGQGQIKPDDYDKWNLSAGFTDIIFRGGSSALCRPNKTAVIGRDSADSVPGNWGGPFKDGCLMALGNATVRMFSYDMRVGTIQDGVCNVQINWRPGEERNPGNVFGTYLTPSGGEAPILRCE